MRTTSISIIGSFRQHYSQVVAAARVFETAGIRVKSPALSKIVNPDDDFVRFESDPPSCSNLTIQQATLGKILHSDFVYVVCPDGYIGRTTSYELGQVHYRGIPVYFSEFPNDLPIEVRDEAVVNPEALAQLLRTKENTFLTTPPVLVKHATDLVVFTIREDRLMVLLIVRGKAPFRGRYAFPGGFLRQRDGELEGTALRELAEEAGLDGNKLPLEQLRTYSKAGRDPRGWVITTAFVAIAPNLPRPVGGSDAASADWYEVEDSLFPYLAFDHGIILRDALESIRTRLEQTPLATAFCANPFTLTELRRVFELVWGISIDAPSFQRKVLRIEGFVQAIGQKRPKLNGGRPPELYEPGEAKVLQPPYLRPPNARALSQSSTT